MSCTISSNESGKRMACRRDTLHSSRYHHIFSTHSSALHAQPRTRITHIPIRAVQISHQEAVLPSTPPESRLCTLAVFVHICCQRIEAVRSFTPANTDSYIGMPCETFAVFETVVSVVCIRVILIGLRAKRVKTCGIAFIEVADPAFYRLNQRMAIMP